MNPCTENSSALANSVLPTFFKHSFTKSFENPKFDKLLEILFLLFENASLKYLKYFSSEIWLSYLLSFKIFIPKNAESTFGTGSNFSFGTVNRYSASA